MILKGRLHACCIRNNDFRLHANPVPRVSLLCLPWSQRRETLGTRLRDSFDGKLCYFLLRKGKKKWTTLDFKVIYYSIGKLHGGLVDYEIN